MTFERVASSVYTVLPPDPLAAEWSDPAWQDAWFAQLVDESDAAGLPPDDLVPDPEVAVTAAAGAVHELIVDELSGGARAARAMAARQYQLIDELVRHAASEPEPWVGPDPTLDPAWTDPRGRSIAQVRAVRREFAARAAVMDVAVRLQASEQTVRARAEHARTLATRCPRVWAAFLAGEVPEPNAVVTSRLAGSLPRADRDAWAAFDEGALSRAMRLTPAKFRVSARALRERVHPETIDERHDRAAEERGVWMSAEIDGMATITGHVPAAKAREAMSRADAIARHLREQAGETRTLAQLRADVFVDLLTESTTPDSADAERGRGAPAVAITVPALTLLGQSDEPAMLEGYGPIDRKTAARLAGSARSWVRILTHPVTGVTLKLDRKTHRVPAALRRWLGVVHPTCIAPGCMRVARECDIDHRVEWRHGGTTDEQNLGPLCERDHQVKTETLWSLYFDRETRQWNWASPTGLRLDLDPPPF